MRNGSLQDALLDRKCPELMEWKKRYAIAINVARGIQILHCLNPPIIHGDIKPSNILIDAFFNAKLADFGLARALTEDEVSGAVLEIGEEGRKVGRSRENGDNDNGSILEETESVVTDDVALNVDLLSPEVVTTMSSDTGVFEAPPSSVSECCLDIASVDSGNRRCVGRKKSLSGRDWWWKQDGGSGVGSESGRVKDYVMEWIGSEIKKERPKSEWVVGGASTSGPVVVKPEKPERKKDRRRLDWWTSLDEDKVAKREKRRPAREWWKEEYCEELSRKKKKKKNKQGQGTSSLEGNSRGDLWPVDVDFYVDRKKKRRSSRSSSRNSVDWWLDGLSGELWRGGRGGDNSHESAGGDIPKSGGVSSTPSMRGTVCYVAPEYGGGGAISEKCDVYSYGVLLLVLIAGRRPLQVTGSPMSEFKRANLISWAKQLARAGKLLDLVDKSIQVLDREQALLCITIALLCLQKSPARRPSMKEVVGMLSGELEPPRLPVEFSPSTPSRFPYKSQRKGR